MQVKAEHADADSEPEPSLRLVGKSGQIILLIWGDFVATDSTWCAMR